MKNNGKADSTIKDTDKSLTYLSTHADLDKPEQVKRYIANLNCGNGYKHNLCLAYGKYCDYYQIQWQPPIYKRKSRAIRIPTKAQIEMLTASAGKVLSIKLTLEPYTRQQPNTEHPENSKLATAYRQP